MGLFIGIIVGYFACNTKGSDADSQTDISDSLAVIAKERDSALKVIKVLSLKNDSMDYVIETNKLDVDRLSSSINTLRDKLVEKDSTISKLKRNSNVIRYRYLSDDSLIVELKNKFRDIK